MLSRQTRKSCRADDLSDNRRCGSMKPHGHRQPLRILFDLGMTDSLATSRTRHSTSRPFATDSTPNKLEQSAALRVYVLDSFVMTSARGAQMFQ